MNTFASFAFFAVSFCSELKNLCAFVSLCEEEEMVRA